MSNQEFCNEKMAKISQPIDIESDPFANLFGRRTKKPEIQEAAVSQQKGPEVKTSRVKTPPPRRPVPRQPVPRQEAKPPRLERVPVRKKNQSAAIFLWVPAASIVVLGTFFVGLYGGNFAMEKLIDNRAEITGRPIGNLAVVAPQKPDSKALQKRAAQQSSVLAVSPPKRVPLVSKPEQIVAISPAINPAVGPVIPNLVPLARPAPPVPEVKIAALSTIGTQEEVANLLAGRISILLRQGHLLEKINDYRGARAKFRQALEAGSSVAALAIARTYDQRAYKNNDAGLKYRDAKLAREWYEKWFLAALEGGNISPRARYDRLLAGLKEN